MGKLITLTIVTIVSCSLAHAGEPPVKTVADDASISIVQSDKILATYQLKPDKKVELPVESACYFHPLKTPAGIPVTDVAPFDHPHHRGVFLGWVEMHGGDGGVNADFWGWGEHAPTKDRRIVHRELLKAATGKGCAFEVRNEWMAGEQVVIDEYLRADARNILGATVLDVQYTLTPKSEIKLARWAFSGFCVRTRLDGRLEAFGPGGRVDLPNPSHLKPESDWPAAPWYGYELRGVDRGGPEGGLTVGVAVVDHPKNPPTLWHNHRGIGMLNPCIVAPAAVTMKTDDPPLVLRYRVIAFDGQFQREIVTRLADDFRKNYPP
jgi:Family of unknown function (DUF6807)